MTEKEGIDVRLEFVGMVAMMASTAKSCSKKTTRLDAGSGSQTA